MSINAEKSECPLKGFDWLALPNLEFLKAVTPVDLLLQQIKPDSDEIKEDI